MAWAEMRGWAAVWRYHRDGARARGVGRGRGGVRRALGDGGGEGAVVVDVGGVLVDLEEDAHHVDHYLESDTLVTEGSMD